MRRTRSAPQGDGSNYTNPAVEPPDHGIGRSRGGLSTKIHQLVDGNGLPLITLITPGQAGDSPMLLPLPEQLRVGRQIGRPRTRPDAVRGDKAYSSRATRTQLRERGIKAVIPEPRDQQGHRERRGPRGGRPVVLDAADHKNRNVIERRFCHTKAMARPRHPLRQTRDRLPSCRPHPRRNRLDPRFVRHALTLPRAAGSGSISPHPAACDRITRCQSSLSALSTSATSPLDAVGNRRRSTVAHTDTARRTTANTTRPTTLTLVATRS